ncbi:hypothetical protein [Paenirhodobacter populi]|uniref:DNA-binding protein n=1 Tax=Paenirhodobacter populi TaxID=2306993 RepID=A0A443JR19_9RHOB|nr:hypothetical protein [Sinirhodobacter populi]RWR22944.1 hypothetical protein D2T30_04770 [Sinirhodobacter populi]
MVAALRDNGNFSELKEALAGLPLRDGEREFSRIAGMFLKRHGNRFRLSARPEPLSVAETEALRSVGVAADAADPDASPIMQTAVSYAALVATALPLAEVAAKLGVTDGRLRQRVAEGSLLAVHGSDGRTLRIPPFQLTETGELPGLRGIMRAIRRDLRPVQTAAFFTTLQSDLEDAQGEAMTPVDWLLSGHDPEPVRELAKSL